MPARIRKIRHDEDTRAKIQASQLINRLQNHALGKTEMEQSQIKAAEVLLRKSLPDLSATDMTHHAGEGLQELLKAIDGRTRGIPKSG